MKRLIMILALIFMSVPVFAVDDDANSPCDGVHNLDYLFVEVYWKEGTTWYKVPNSDMYAVYPWKCMLNNSCGGIIPWGESHTCYISGHANDKVTVSESSVPCRNENSNATSCWVWKDQNLNSQYNIYRIDIDSHYIYSEPWLNYRGDEGYELWAYQWSDKRWSYFTNYLTGNTTYTSESRTDIRNGDVSWVKTDSNWSVTILHKKVEKRYRLMLFPNWIYYWESTANTSNFRQFQISLTKGTGANPPLFDGSSDFSEKVNTENDFIRDIDLSFSEKVKINSLDETIKEILFPSTEKEEDDYSSSLRIDRLSDDKIAGLAIEKIDEEIKNENNYEFEGVEIIAINGYKLEEFEKVEDMFKYLSEEEIFEITVLDEKMNLYNLVSE